MFRKFGRKINYLNTVQSKIIDAPINDPNQRPSIAKNTSQAAQFVKSPFGGGKNNRDLSPFHEGNNMFRGNCSGPLATLKQRSIGNEIKKERKKKKRRRGAKAPPSF